MPTARGRRAVLLASALALAAGTAGVAFGDRPAAGAGDSPPLRAGQWSLSSGAGDVIQVRSRKCPKHHPHRVGSYSYRTTRIENGKVESHSGNGSVCAK
jgi:hypothetical protein